MPLKIAHRLLLQGAQVRCGLPVEIARHDLFLIRPRESDERCVDRGRQSRCRHTVFAGDDGSVTSCCVRGIADACRHDARCELSGVYLENSANIDTEIPECRPKRWLRLFLERRFVRADREVAVFLLVVLKDELPFCRLDLLDGDVHDVLLMQYKPLRPFPAAPAS